MMTEEPNHVYHDPSALGCRREAGDPRRGAPDRPVDQRSVSSSSGGRGPVLCLGATGSPGCDLCALEQQAGPQGTGRIGGAHPTYPASAVRRCGTVGREPGPEKRVLARAPGAWVIPSDRARIVESVSLACGYTGRSVREVLQALGVQSSSYYRWMH